MSDGTTREHFNLFYSEDDATRIRLGYCCIQCGESVVGHGKGVPFPEECSVCKFPMARLQSERFAKEWMGSVRIGPSTSFADELAMLEELEEKQNPKPSILVPKIWG